MLNKCTILKINTETAKVHVQKSACSNISLSSAKLHIYRYGYSLPLLEYDILDERPDRITFYLDSLFYDLPEGRYYGIVLSGDTACGRVEIELDKACRVGASHCEVPKGSVCLDTDPSSCEGDLCS